MVSRYLEEDGRELFNDTGESDKELRIGNVGRAF
jgi:hypothetical protein